MSHFMMSKQQENRRPYRRLDETMDCTPHTAIIDLEPDEQATLFGYKYSLPKRIVFGIFSFFTVGFLLLVGRWRPAWKVRMTCVQCPLSVADVLILKDTIGYKYVVKIKVKSVSGKLAPELTYQRPNNPGENDSLYLHSARSHSYRYFMYNCMKYVWDKHLECFKRLKGFDEGVPCVDFHEKFSGLSAAEQKERLELYDENRIDIKVKSYLKLFVDEVLNPFYVFQIASMTLWFMDNYYYYATCIGIISLTSITISLYETKKQRITLRNMVSNSNEVNVTVCREGCEFQEISAASLVPGDVISIPPNGCLMACDAVLIAGNCIVNESMLTGESVPETKIPVPYQEEVYSAQQHKRYTLFCGTQVIQTRYYGSNKVLAVVVRTGYYTAKGELVRSILFAKEMSFKFYKDAVKFILLLFCLSVIGMAYSIYIYIERGSSAKDTIIRTLDIVTIVVPPALPAAMTIGTVYAQNRLKKQGIYCISPPRINVAGKLKLVCFDKTGTLTEDGLDLWGIVPVDNSVFQMVHKRGEDIKDQSPLKIAMACCHSLTMINEKLTGDPLDLNMFNATNWELEEPGSDDNAKYDQLPPTVVRPIGNAVSISDSSDHQLSKQVPLEVGILRQFPFASELQRMSVICRTLGSSHLDLYTKGAPEKIASLCVPDTIPSNFSEFLHAYTIEGFRVIALAFKNLNPKLNWHQAQRIKREEVECDLNFLGLLIMQNSLKEETTPIIQLLQSSNIRTVMITGDNLLTAISVARNCSIIGSLEKIIVITASLNSHTNHAMLKFENAELSKLNKEDGNVHQNASGDRELCSDMQISINNSYHFAVEGKSYGIICTHFPDLLPKLYVRGTVFARMAPEQKAQIVSGLQELSYIVAMCGDGANDCGALKMADVGISLSEAEASVAAPFTSNIPNIECVPILIREGRCSLVTTFSIFRFIALYSIIQFTSVLILYTENTNVTDPMFLYIDLGIITTLTVVMSNTKPYPDLVSKRPHGSLVSIANISSLLLQIILTISMQALTMWYLQIQPWYVPHIPTEADATASNPNWENAVIFLVSSQLYIIVCITFSEGPPFRQPFYFNIWFTVILFIIVTFTTFLLFNPFAIVAKIFTVIQWQPNHHFKFRLGLLGIIISSLILSLALEEAAQSLWFKRLIRKVIKKHRPKNEYKIVENEIKSNHDWPVMDETTCCNGTVIVNL